MSITSILLIIAFLSFSTKHTHVKLVEIYFTEAKSYHEKS